MAVEKGALTQKLMESCDIPLCQSVTGIYNDLLDRIDHKRNYTTQSDLDKNPNGLGFFANNL